MALEKKTSKSVGKPEDEMEKQFAWFAILLLLLSSLSPTSYVCNGAFHIRLSSQKPLLNSTHRWRRATREVPAKY